MQKQKLKGGKQGTIDVTTVKPFALMGAEDGSSVLNGAQDQLALAE